MHDETLLRPREGPEQASVMLGVRNTEMSERLRRHGNVALRLPRPARRRAHFVSHAYIVPHATDKTRWVGPDRRPDPGARLACGPRRSPRSPTRTPRLPHRDRRRAPPAHQGGHRPRPNARGSTGPAGLRENTARELTGTAGSYAVICCGSAVVGDDRPDWNVYSQLGHRFPACARRPDLTGSRSFTIAFPLVRATLRARQDSNPRPAA
jgi:hypothetical protein